MTVFGRETYSFSPFRGSVVFFELCYGYTCCTLLFFFVQEFLKLYAFFQSYKTRLNANSLRFAFPGVVLNAQVCVVSLNSALRLVFCVCSLATAKLAQNCGKGISHGVGACLCVQNIGGAQEPIGMTYRWNVPSSSWMGFLMESSQLIESISLWYALITLSVPLPLPLHLQYSTPPYACWRKREEGFFGSNPHKWGAEHLLTCYYLTT